MSNRLIRAARQIERVRTPAGDRDIFPSEHAVLVALADDAREVDGDRTRLGATELSRRTRCSLRTVKRALVVLQQSGLITRVAGGQGDVSTTTVHPVLAMSPVSSCHGTRATMTRDPCHHDTGPIESHDSTIIPVTSAGAREPVVDEVDQVLDAWDAMAAAKGLPGPVRRTERRAAAIRDKLGQDKLWRVLAAVRKVGESDFLRGLRRAPGQGDFRADFDFVFETTPAFKAKATWDRLLEGSFGGPPVPIADPGIAYGFAPTTEDRKPEAVPGEPPEMRELRAALRQQLGAATFDTWIAPLRFVTAEGETLQLSAPTGFIADWVTANFRERIRAACEPVWGQRLHLSLVVGQSARAEVGDRRKAQSVPTQPCKAGI